ncbi:MAG: peptidylprolyl isomerase [Clostridia bacterium]|nr:peptidylprolyl isomerase [Clostridia bacterium]
MKKIIRIIALVLAAMFVLCSCSNTTLTTSSASDTTAPAGNVSDDNIPFEDDAPEAEDTEASTKEHSQVKFTMANGGSFVVELYPEYAPKTVENFVSLVSEGFYDGLTFHRVVEDFMAQGGDPEGTGMGGSDKNIKGEFINNGFTQNTLSHTRGVISMARSSNPNSASSQFFICYGDATFLDGDYAAFGMVTEGMEVVDSFLEIERTIGNDGALSSPVEPIVIEKAEVIQGA